jgi:hypothetical protein
MLAGGIGNRLRYPTARQSKTQKEQKMAKYLVVHPVGKELTLELGTPIGKAIKAGLTPDAYWLRSEYVREVGKLYCHWDAKDAESIRQVFAKAAPEFPVEGIYELELMTTSEDFR